MKFGFYAYTVGPEGMFKIIGNSAEKRGHAIIQFEANKPGVVAARKTEMNDCDIVAIGGDSARIEESIELLEHLLSLNVPVIVVEDTPGVALRPALRPFAQKLKGCVVAMPSGRANALEFGYGAGNLVEFLGPPAHLGISYHSMMDAPSIRPQFMRVNSGASVPLHLDDKVIYVPGTKVPEVNNVAIGGAIAAGKDVLGDNFVFHFRKHPGETANEKIEGDKERYDKLFAEREEIWKGVSLLEPGKVGNPELVRAADVTVFPGGGPTESIVAAYARLATCYCWDDLVASELKKIGIADGRWYVAELGGSLKVTGVEELSHAVLSLLTNEGRAKLQMTQEANFPLPESWDTAPKVVDFLEMLA